MNEKYISKENENHEKDRQIRRIMLCKLCCED